MYISEVGGRKKNKKVSGLDLGIVAFLPPKLLSQESEGLRNNHKMDLDIQSIEESRGVPVGHSHVVPGTWA